MANLSKLQQAIDHLTEAESILSDIVDERRDIAENRSEAWQESERGIGYEDRTSELEEAQVEAESAMGRVENFLAN